jgi:replication-associated recombination protein RarA
MFEENRAGMPLAERLRRTAIDEVIGQKHPRIFGLPPCSVVAKHG